MSTFKDNLTAVLQNPALMETVAYTALSDQLSPLGSFEVPDGTIPFVWAMELGCVETALAVDAMKSEMRKRYPQMALAAQEIYLHMSDRDYIGRFATPAQTSFSIFLDYAEVLSKAIAYGNQGARKLVIPRLTEFDVEGLKFTMQYPLELRVMRHGGIQAVYDTTVASPIGPLETNIADWRLVQLDRVDRPVMEIRIPVGQFAIETFTETLNPSTLFRASYSFPNQFYMARAYIKNDSTNNEWSEVATTHTDQVYNPAKLTVALQVANGTVKAVIPPVYNRLGLATGMIRLDVYTTEGLISRDMGSFRPSQFKATFNDIDDDKVYVAPLKTMTMNHVLSSQLIAGGSNAMDFNVLRDQVIDNTIGPNDLPITNVQIAAELKRRGYDLVSNVDNLTKRQFLAARQLSTPKSLDVVSGAGTVMSVLQVQMAELAASKHVKDNGKSITVLPSMLYSYNLGKVTVVPDAQLDSLLAMGVEELTRTVNEARYVYTPFHYVLDASSDNFDCRPYYLDNPTISRKYFVMENDTSLLQVAIDEYNIVKTDYGYRIDVVLEEGEQFKKLDTSQIVLQASYLPANEVSWVAVNSYFAGTTTDNKRAWSFDIKTDFEINASHQVYTTNMSMHSDAQTRFGFDLETNVDITVCVVDTQTPGYQANALDQMVQAHLLPSVYMTVTRERLLTTFGYDMTRLWRRNRTLVTDQTFKRYPENVYAVWEEDQYLTDINGNAVIGYDGTAITYTITAHKGDFQLDAHGDKIIKYPKGEVMFDANQQPIKVEERKIARELTMFMVDGLFYFANEKNALAYKKEIPMELVEWLRTDLAYASKTLLEAAKIYLYPTMTFGETLATVKDGITATVQIDQALSFNYYLSHAAYSNNTIRPAITKNTKAEVVNTFAKQTVSMIDLTGTLKVDGGDDVVGLEGFGLGGPDNYPVITIEDDAVRFAVKKKLVPLANQELTVEDDLTINFLRHTLPIPIGEE